VKFDSRLLFQESFDSQGGVQAQDYLSSAKRLRLILSRFDASLSLHPLHANLAGHWAVTVQANWRVISFH